MPFLYDASTAPGTMSGGLALTERGLGALAQNLSAKRLLIVADMPFFDSDPIPCIALQASGLLRKPCTPHIATSDFLERQAPTYAALLRVQEHHDHVRVLLPGNALCATGGQCLVYVDGQFIYRDRNHIRRNLPEPVQARLATMIGLDVVLAP